MAPGHLGEPARGRGVGAPPRVARCDAAAGASDTAAELLADAASRVPVDGTESAGTADASRRWRRRSRRRRRATPPPPRIRARRVGKRFPSPRLPPGSGPGDSRASSTPSTARLLPPRIRVRRDRKRKRKRKRNRRSRSPSSSPCGPPRWRRFWTRRRGDASRSRSRTARDFELTEPALASAAACALVREPAGTGGDALRAWLVSLVASERFDVAAVALRWVSGGPGAGHGAGDLGADQNDADQNGVFESSKQPSRESNDQRHARSETKNRGERSGVARPRRRGGRRRRRRSRRRARVPPGTPEANAAAQAAALDAMAPSAKLQRVARARRRRRCARLREQERRRHDARGFGSRRDGDVARVVGVSERSDERNRRDGARRLKTRVTPTRLNIQTFTRWSSCVASPRSAVRGAAGRSMLPARRRRVVAPTLGRPRGARRRRPARARCREDAAAELGRAQLRCGNGAGSADFARRRPPSSSEPFACLNASPRRSTRRDTRSHRRGTRCRLERESRGSTAPRRRRGRQPRRGGSRARRAPPPASWSPPPATACAAPRAHSGAHGPGRARRRQSRRRLVRRARWRAGGVWWEASAPASPSCTRGRTLRVWANTQTRAPTTRSPFLRDSERTGTPARFARAPRRVARRRDRG